jgi:Putative beta-barrel porin 2
VVVAVVSPVLGAVAADSASPAEALAPAPVAADASTAAGDSAPLKPAPEASEASWWSKITPQKALNIEYGKFLIKPHFSTALTFTDNYNYASSGREQSEQLLSISPGFKLQYGGTEVNHIYTDYAFDDISYLQHSQFSTTQNHIQFGDDLTYRRFHIGGTDTIDFLSSFIGSGNSLRSILIDRRTWADNYNINYDATDYIQPYLNFNHYNTTYAPGVRLYGSDNLQGSLGSSYQATLNIKVFADVLYGQTSVFSDAAPSLPNNAPHSDLLGGHVGAKGSFTRDLTGSLTLGYVERSFAPEVHAAASTTPTVTANLTYTLTDKLAVQATMERHSDVSANFGSQSTIFQTITLTINQYIGNSLKWMVQANSSLTQIGYSHVIISGFDSARDDTVFDVGASVIYQPQPWITASLGYNFENYQAKFLDAKYAASNAGLTLLGYRVNQIVLQAKIGF